MQFTKLQINQLIDACHFAILQEGTYIDAYINVHDGTEKDPIFDSKKRIKQWERLIGYMENYKENINDKPIIIEKFADNGERSHWELINNDGEILWSGDKK